MRKGRKVLSALLAVILLVGTVRAYAVNNDSDALNGSTCSGTDFDKSVYTNITNMSGIRNNDYPWPSSGAVLVEVSGSNWEISDFKDITIPAGLTVDIYQYYKYSGDADKTYKLVGHFDTTDGNTYTIGSSSTATPSSTTAPDAEGGLNGSTCSGADFDKSVYTTVVGRSVVESNTYRWPSSGAVLVVTPGGDLSDLNGVIIPAGIIVDYYLYYQYVGDPDTTYELLGHFDTTDGQPYTIDSGTPNRWDKYKPGVAPDADGWTPRYDGEPKWNKVFKTFTPGTPSASYENSYNDVTSDMWCYDAIMTLTDGGLLNGYGNGKFGPDDALTRAQVAIIEARTGGSYLMEGFEKARFDNGYQPYLDYNTATRAWAGIVLAGTMPEFRPISLTRYEQSLVANTIGLTSENIYKNSMCQDVYDVWRASLAKDIDYRLSIDEFPDAADIHKWIDENADLISNFLILRGSHEYKVERCEYYFLRAYNLGMFSGIDSEGTFDPYGPITRGQLCQILYNVGWTYAKCLDYYGLYR